MNWYKDDPLYLFNLTREFLRVKFRGGDIKDWFCEDSGFLNSIKLVADMVYDQDGYLAVLEGMFNCPMNETSLCEEMAKSVTRKRIIEVLAECNALSAGSEGDTQKKEGV